MAGTFGYELDPAKLTEEEKEEIRKQIGRFKEYYELIQRGDYFRLTAPSEERHYAAWEFVSPDQKEALVSVVASKVRTNDPPARVLFKRAERRGNLPSGRQRIYRRSADVRRSSAGGKGGVSELGVLSEIKELKSRKMSK